MEKICIFFRKRPVATRPTELNATFGMSDGKKRKSSSPNVVTGARVKKSKSCATKEQALTEVVVVEEEAADDDDDDDRDGDADRNKRTRLNFDPHDRILFLHYGSNRMFEALVTDVERRFFHVRIHVPTLPKAKPTQNDDEKKTDSKTEGSEKKTDGKTRGKCEGTRGKCEGRVSVVLDAYRAFEDYELMALYRPAFFQMEAPPGFYLNHAATDLWLELDDVFEIVKQGSRVQPAGPPDTYTNTYNPDMFVARVKSVNEITCQITPIRTTTANRDDDDANENNFSTPRKDDEVSRILDQLESASGTVPEWVPRNTLRFRRFIRKSNLRATSLEFTLTPSTTASTSSKSAFS